MSKFPKRVAASSKKSPVRLCRRCSVNPAITTLFVVSAHTWFTPSQSDFNVAMPPRSEGVCGDCITGDELIRQREIGDVVLYATGVLLENGQRQGNTDSTMAALETVRAYFQVRNNDSDDPEATKQRQKDTVLRLLK